MTMAGTPARCTDRAARMLWVYMRVWMTQKSGFVSPTRRPRARIPAGRTTGNRPFITGHTGRRTISMPSASVSRAGRPGRALVTTTARCPACTVRRARFQVYRSTPPTVGRYWAEKYRMVTGSLLSSGHRARMTSMMFKSTPKFTAHSPHTS